MTSMTYGGSSRLPSSSMPPTASSNELCATTRCSSLNSIASASAVRISWTMSSRDPTLTGPAPSSMVIRMPGPGHRDEAGEDVEGAGPLLGLGQRGLAAGVLGLELVAGLLEAVPLAARALGGAGEGVEDLDEVLLAQPGVGVVLLGVADLHDGGEAEHREQDGDDDLGARAVAQGGRQALAARVLVLAGLGRARGAGSSAAQAWKRWRRMAATLEKIRMPRTTTTPVESWLPTPSLSPR